MREMIIWLQSQREICIKSGNQVEADTLNGHISVATELLAKEKQDIIDAHTEGQALIIGILNERFNGQFIETFAEIEKARNGDNDIKATDYFTQKYEQ